MQEGFNLTAAKTDCQTAKFNLLTLEGAGGGTIVGIMDGGAGVAMAAGTMGALPARMDCHLVR